MADLYNLQLDGVEEEPQQEIHSEEEWDQDDAEHLDLPPALEEAERRKLQGTPDATTEADRVDLEDLQATDAVDMPYSLLKNLWTQELDSPELLPYAEETINSLTDALREQEQRIDDLNAYGSGATGNANLDALTASLIRVDADRVKFVICSLLRERLRKIEEHPLYMRQHVDRMSANEAEFLKGYGSLLERHLSRTVLDHFPQDKSGRSVWKKLDAPEMIDEPNLETYVFIKTKEDVSINNGTADRPEFQQHDKGSCLIVRYSRIRDLFVEDKVELLM